MWDGRERGRQGEMHHHVEIVLVAVNLVDDNGAKSQRFLRHQILQTGLEILHALLGLRSLAPTRSSNKREVPKRSTTCNALGCTHSLVQPLTRAVAQ